MMGAGGWSMRFPIIFTLLLFVGAAHALPFSEWTDNQAAGKCTGDLRRAYGDTLSVVSFMGKQPHEDNTTLVGLVVSDGRTEYKGQQVVLGCVYKQDASLITIFFNSKIANWTAPEKRQPARASSAVGVEQRYDQEYAPSTATKSSASKPQPSPTPQSGQSRTSSPPDSDESFGVWTLVIFIIVLAAYFLPSMIAGSREHHQGKAILVLNLFLGWTFLGWVVALVWSLTATQGASTKK